MSGILWLMVIKRAFSFLLLTCLAVCHLFWLCRVFGCIGCVSLLQMSFISSCIVYFKLQICIYLYNQSPCIYIRYHQDEMAQCVFWLKGQVVPNNIVLFLHNTINLHTFAIDTPLGHTHLYMSQLYICLTSHISFILLQNIL